MFTEFRLLVVNQKLYVLGKGMRDEYGTIHKIDHIGSMALAFANTDLTYLKDLSSFKQWVLSRLGEACSHSVEGPGSSPVFLESPDIVQGAVMGIIGLLEKRPHDFWFFEIERSKLEKIDKDLIYGNPDIKWLHNELMGILDFLESLVQFQETLKTILADLSLAHTKGSCHASSAHILCNLFDAFPDIFSLCFGSAGYMLVDVDEQGDLRSEMLDINMENAFRRILEPELPPLEYNSPKDNKLICEYRIVSDVKRCIMYDLIEGLRNSNFIAQCATCNTFFLTSDKRIKYCPNGVCNSYASRMRKRNEQIRNDPFLKEAYRYQNAMRSRYLRANNAARQSRVKPISHTEYETWTDRFHSTLKCYEEKKARALLRGASQEEISKIGAELLDIIRPEGYKPNKKEETP